jgi:hypothetical protein
METTAMRRVSAALGVLLGTALVIGGLTVPSAAFAAGDASIPSCGAETEASPGFVAYLPDCRAYELVTPPYKEAGVVEFGGPAAISPDGSHAIVGVGGAFAGAGNFWWQESRNPGFDAYEFARTETGWAPTVLTPPATEFPHSTLMAADGNNLGTTLWGAATNTLVLNEDIYLRDSSGNFALVGPGSGPEVRDENLQEPNSQLSLVGASRDLTHSVFSVKAFSVVELDDHGGHSNLWPGDTTIEDPQSLYEYAYHGQSNAEPSLVGVENERHLTSNTEATLISKCGTELGSGEENGSMYNAVSETGETVFFTALHGRPGHECTTPSVNELYARINGEKKVAISEPTLPPGECTSGHACFEAVPKEGIFQGASRDGSKVFFLTEQPLVNGDTDTTMDLYEAEIEGKGANAKIGKLIMVSAGEASVGTPGAEKADVQGVVRVSQDGSHVYFVAVGVLTGENAEHHSPEAGADNLYVYDTVTEKTVFVATLLTPEEEATLQTSEEEERVVVSEAAEKAYAVAFAKALSEGASEGEAEQISEEAEHNRRVELKGALGPRGTLAADKSVWALGDAEREAQATPDGRFLVFLSSAPLVKGDESKVPQLFEYSAESEHLTRVSIGSEGTFGHDGNVSTFREAPRIPTQAFNRDLPTAAESGLAVSSDGARVFFTSEARLTPQVEDGGGPSLYGLPNVYEYSGGNVYLISDGKDSSATENKATVQLFGSDASGQDVLFVTADALVPQAPGGQVGLYDAREGGGFPATALAPGCAGETCRGSSAATPPLPLAGSVTQPGGGNLAPPAPAPAAKPKPKASTRAQKLAKALKACRKEPKKKRAACVRQARKRYAEKPKAKKSDRGAK